MDVLGTENQSPVSTKACHEIWNKSSNWKLIGVILRNAKQDSVNSDNIPFSNIKDKLRFPPAISSDMYLHLTMRKDCPLWELCMQLSLQGRFTTSCNKKHRVPQQLRLLRHPNLTHTSQHLPNSWEGWCIYRAPMPSGRPSQTPRLQVARKSGTLKRIQLRHHPIRNVNWNKTRNASLQVVRGILLWWNQNSSLRSTG